MDIRDVPTTELLGKSIFFRAPMNGGKTEGMTQELKRASYYGLNATAYNHESNVRELNAIVVDSQKSHPAKTVNSIRKARADFERRREILFSSKVGYRGKGKTIEIEGIPYVKDLPLQVIGIDEINLFCTTPQDAQDALDFLLWAKRENIALFMAGLLYDFRHMPFKYVSSIEPYIDIWQEKKPACMAISSTGKKCTNTASHTQRVWRLDFVEEAGLEALVDDMDIYNFMDKDKRRLVDQYVPAPFFDKTLRIEEVKNKKVKYLPVCTAHAALPYKEETFQVYEAIVQGQNPRKVLDETINGATLTRTILQFLCSEGWVEKERRKYRAVRYYQNRLGGFSPALL